MQEVTHEFPPFVEEDTTILILGSIPSVQSRKQGFYYMHPQNRFWRVLAQVFEEECPQSLEEKKQFLKRHQIGLYDVLESCTIDGSKDSSIQNPVPSHLLPLIQNSHIARIYTTGKKAHELYQKFQAKELEWEAISLPSTSPLNASFQEEDLVQAYQVIKEKVLTPIVEPLLLWYRQNKRDLPWRKKEDPYAICISEIMLQQTRVEAVIGYYERFLKAFPTVFALANAEEDQLLKQWEGLGYYSRARNLKKTAAILVKDYQGVFPHSYQEILRLPGIGSYTAGAILSIAYHEPYPAVDGNVFRVLSRVLGLFEEITKPLTRVKMEHRVQEILTRQNAKEMNQALMELGATVCLPKKQAKCSACPLQSLCQAYQHQQVEQLPVKAKKGLQKEIMKTILLLECNGRYAVLKRTEKGLLEGLYQFPEMSFTSAQTDVITWCKKEHMEALFVQQLPKKKHVFTHLIWKMNGFYVRVMEESPAFQWVTLEELETLSIPTAFSYYHPKNQPIYF